MHSTGIQNLEFLGVWASGNGEAGGTGGWERAKGGVWDSFGRGRVIAGELWCAFNIPE